jgi:hypothetical protein
VRRNPYRNGHQSERLPPGLQYCWLYRTVQVRAVLVLPLPRVVSHHCVRDWSMFAFFTSFGKVHLRWYRHGRGSCGHHQLPGPLQRSFTTQPLSAFMSLSHALCPSLASRHVHFSEIVHLDTGAQIPVAVHCRHFSRTLHPDDRRARPWVRVDCSRRIPLPSPYSTFYVWEMY